MTKNYFSVHSSQVTEGDSLRFWVNRWGDLTQEARVSLTTTGGSARAWEDFHTTYGQVYFDPGERQKVFEVKTIDDSNIESTEGMNINIVDVYIREPGATWWESNDRTIEFRTGRNSGTIIDNDPQLQLSTISISDATADGVAKNLPVLGYTTVAVLDSAAHRAGVVPSRGVHDSFPLFFEVVLFAIGFDQP